MIEVPETGKALDERIAREVMGWEQHDGMWYQVTPPDSLTKPHSSEGAGRDLPPFSSDRDAAQEVIKRMQERGWIVEINPGTKPGHQIVSARKNDSAVIGGMQIEVAPRSLPGAICVVALEAIASETELAIVRTLFCKSLKVNNLRLTGQLKLSC